MRSDESERQNTFDSWMREHKGVLFKVVRAYAYTAEDQDDLFQEITLQVWHSIPNYRGDAAVTTWLYRIAFYVALDWLQKEKKDRTGKQSVDGVEHVLTERSTAKDSRLQWLYEQIALTRFK